MTVIYRGVIIAAVCAAIFSYNRSCCSDKLPIRIEGYVKPGFEPVLEALRQNFEDGYHIGAAYSAYHEGELVVDLWGGYANQETGQLWEENTLTTVFSATKIFSALSIALLVDRGHLDYEKPVASYWPEFAQNGKENITVGMLASHKAGLPLFGQQLNETIIKDDKAMGELLAGLTPIWVPGSQSGYHPTTLGHLFHQLVIRTDPKRRSLGQFVQEEITKPFDLDFYIGLPYEENYRVAKCYTEENDILGIILTALKYHPSVIFQAFDLVRNKLFPGSGSLLSQIFTDSSFFTAKPRGNSPDFRKLELPSSGGIGSAKSLAKLYSILANGGKDPDGNQLVSTATLEKLSLPSNPDGWCAVFNAEQYFGYGTMIRVKKDKYIFGHHGWGGMFADSDPHAKLSWGYTSNKLTGFGWDSEPWFQRIKKATYKCVE